jgi:hypothetical protein
MAKTSTTSVSVAVSGDGVAETFTPSSSPVINASAPAGGPISVALSTGDNTLTVPPGAQGFVFVPPTSSVVVKKLKGIAGDTGFTLSPTLPSVIMLPAGATTALVNAASSETVSIHWI